MNAFTKPNPRPFFRAKYGELKKSYKQETENYLNALNALLYELEHRRVPWDVELRNEVCRQIASVQEGLRQAMRRLP